MTHRVACAALLAALLAAQTSATRAATLLFATDTETDSLYSVNPATGAASRIGPLGFEEVTGLDFAPDGTLYGTDTEADQLVTIDPATGAATAVGSLGKPFVDSLAFIGNTLYGVDRSTDQLVTIDTATGAATDVGSLDFGEVIGLAADAGGSLFGTDLTTDEFLSVNPATGEASVIGSHRPTPTTDTFLVNLTCAPDGTLFATDFAWRLLTVDPATGALTDVGPLGQRDIFGLAAAPEGFGVVPLPAAGWLLLSGLGALAVLRRRGQPA